MYRQNLHLLPAFFTLSLLFPRVAPAETLGEGWTFRRPLAFHQVNSDAPGDNCAWSEFYANSSKQPDGADFRVTTADRQIVSHKLMQVSKDDDFVRIAFVTRGDGPYYVWWGNPKAAKPEKDLEIRRGILLEVMRNSLRPALALERPDPGPVIASFCLPEISIGYNPLGDDHNVLLRYTGQFKIDHAIKPQLAFTASDAAVLFIDNHEIDRSRGGLRGRVRDPVPAELSIGWHTIEVRQLNQNQANIALALAWQRPGEANYSPFPGAVFAPAVRAFAGTLEKTGAPFAADFSIDPTAEGFIPPSNYVQRYSFEAVFPATLRPTIAWDFGDGQTSTGLKRVSHVYLAPGHYSVTLKLSGTPDLTATARILVKDRMYSRFPRPPEDPARALAAVLREYDPARLPPPEALQGVLFFDSAGDIDNLLTWGRAWLQAKETTPLQSSEEQTLREETRQLARTLQQRRKDKEAAELFRLASDKPAQPDTRAQMMRRYVITMCDFVGDADAALAEAQAWAARLPAGASRQARLVQSAVAYAAIAKGDAKLARSAMVAATAGMTPKDASTLNQQEIRQGVLTRNIENYIRTKEFDTAWELVDQWEEEFPASVWDGFTRTLRVKLAAAEGRNLVAAHMALAHARTNPEGFYAAELLFRAAENFRAGGEQPQAKVALDLLNTKYPESPYARGATPAP